MAETTTTPRIRWEQERPGCMLGYVGTLSPWAFQISKPAGFRWTLMTQLPGLASNQGYEDSPEAHKAKAEELLAAFAASLGAIFPGTLRTQVQQARSDYYEQACDHGDMTGHEEQEARAFDRVEALDEVLGWLAEAEPATKEER